MHTAMLNGWEVSAWQGHAIIRILVAMLLGAVVGMEREHRGGAAGLRTQMLVALGSSLAMVVSLNFANIFGARTPETAAVQVDPARVAYGVMVGIGFLGAGTIIHHGQGIRGLTTAAGLWCTAAIGLACGFGMFIVAIVATAMAFLSLSVLSGLDRRIPAHIDRTLTVTLPMTAQDNIKRFTDILRGFGAAVENIEYSARLAEKTEQITFYISLAPHHKPSDLLTLVKNAPDLLDLSLR